MVAEFPRPVSRNIQSATHTVLLSASPDGTPDTIYPPYPCAIPPPLRIALARTKASRKRPSRLPFHRGLTYSPVSFVGIRSEPNRLDAKGRGPSRAPGSSSGKQATPCILEFFRTQRGHNEDGHRAKKSGEEKAGEGRWERMNTAGPETGLLARMPDARRRDLASRFCDQSSLRSMQSCISGVYTCSRRQSGSNPSYVRLRWSRTLIGLGGSCRGGQYGG